MSRFASYLIAQHVPDLMRRESRNVGVFVKIGDEVTGRFFGDVGINRLDRRKINTLPYPDVYRQWVDYWWQTIREPGAFENLKRTGRDHFPVIEGGEVWDVGNDSVQEVAEALFTSLVGDGNFAASLGGYVPEEDVAASLRDSISASFSELNILAGGELGQNVLNPVRSGITVRGERVPNHRPTFVQGDVQILTVAEAIDLTGVKRNAKKDHAGWAAFMLSDIHALYPGAATVSIIRATDDDLRDDYVSYAVEMLESSSTMLNWLDDEQQDAFLERCREKAVAV